VLEIFPCELIVISQYFIKYKVKCGG
jgi:hypothetical protein